MLVDTLKDKVCHNLRFCPAFLQLDPDEYLIVFRSKGLGAEMKVQGCLGRVWVGSSLLASFFKSGWANGGKEDKLRV